MKNIVIVGASHAGLSAAINLKKTLADEVNVVLLERGGDEGFSFVGADGLLWVSGDIAAEHMGYTTPENTRAKGIDLRMETEVVDINFETKTVLADANGERLEFKFDYLVLATGSSPNVPEFAADYLSSSNIPNRVQTMKTVQDARNMRAIVDKPSFKKIAIVGGGYIGVETAETLIKAGVTPESGREVTLIQGADRLCNTYYDPEVAVHIQNIVEQNGVKVQFGRRLSELDFEEFDAYILSLGFHANSELGGEELTREFGAYKVDERLETSRQNVFAIGDCSTIRNNATEKTGYMAIGSSTALEASIVAKVIAERVRGLKPAVFSRGVQGSNALKVFGLQLSSTGLTEEAATKAGYTACAVSFQGTQLAPYLPNLVPEGVEELPELENGQVQLKIVFDFDTRRLLGAQIATHTSAIELVHIFSLAIQQHLTIDELEHLELFFLPQLNQLYNPVFRALSKLPQPSGEQEVREGIIRG